jgi:hypothetical protein
MAVAPPVRRDDLDATEGATRLGSTGCILSQARPDRGYEASVGDAARIIDWGFVEKSPGRSIGMVLASRRCPQGGLSGIAILKQCTTSLTTCCASGG